MPLWISKVGRFRGVPSSGRERPFALDAPREAAGVILRQQGGVDGRARIDADAIRGFLRVVRRDDNDVISSCENTGKVESDKERTRRGR